MGLLKKLRENRGTYPPSRETLAKAMFDYDKAVAEHGAAVAETKALAFDLVRVLEETGNLVTEVKTPEPESVPLMPVESLVADLQRLRDELD